MGHIEGIRNIITFYQDTEPKNVAINGDTWFDTRTTNLYLRINDNWESIRFIRDYIGYAGYYFGGVKSVPTVSYSSSIEKIDFPFDNGVSYKVSELSDANITVGSTGCNSSVFGYIIGGSMYTGLASDVYSSIDKLSFKFDNSTSIKVGSLTQGKGAGSGCNSSTHGYNLCGWKTGYTAVSHIDRIVFPFESGVATIVGNLTVTARHFGSCNSSLYGYGFHCGSGNLQTFINRLTFPFDSGTSNLVGNVNTSSIVSSSYNSSLHGYTLGLSPSVTASSIIERIVFPFNSGISNRVGNLSSSKTFIRNINSSIYGFTMGGYSGNSSNLSIIERITFPFDSGTGVIVGSLTTFLQSGGSLDETDFVTMFS